MLSLTDLKPGVAFKTYGEPYLVLYSEHSKLGRGGAIMRTKIKNLLSGGIVEKTFKGSEEFEEVSIERKKAQYLYNEGDDYHFMNLDNFEQFSLSKKQLGNKYKFLKEELDVGILYYQERPIDIALPIKTNYKVTYTEPGFKGNTQSTTTKSATIENGLEIQVPLFIKNGDIIKVDTRIGKYVERV